jgi:hypothetical protein
MNSIHDEIVALDTNEYLFALRREVRYPACQELFFQALPQLRIYLPLQVLVELQRNLSQVEMRSLWLALKQAQELVWDYAPAPLEASIIGSSEGRKREMPSSPLTWNALKFVI